MEFYAYHGVLEQERIVGNTFLVDVRLQVDISSAIESDQVEDTISYAEVYELVKEEMHIPSNLLEHVAGRIVSQLKHRFPQIKGIRVAVSKPTPPIEGQIGYAKVEIEED